MHCHAHGGTRVLWPEQPAGTAPGQVLPGPPCAHEPTCTALLGSRAPCSAAWPPQAGGPGHPTIAIAGQDLQFPQVQFPWLPALSAHASSEEAERLHSLSSL